MKRNVTFLIVLLLMAAGVMKGQITGSSTAPNFTPYNSSSQTSTFQFPNSGFEHWDTHSGSKDKVTGLFGITYATALGDYTIVPTFWHTFDEASSSVGTTNLNNAAKLNHHYRRSGHNGSHSFGLVCKEVATIPANGALSTGQTRIGSSSAGSASNYNYGHSGASGYSSFGNGTFNYPFTGCPDSLSFWYKTSWSGSAQPIFKVYTYTSNTFKDKANGSLEGDSVGTASHPFNSSTSWKREAWKFNYHHSGNTDGNLSTLVRPTSMLASFSTNKNAGSGNDNDELFVDDLYCIYDKGLATLSIGGDSQNEMLTYFNSREWLTHQNNPNSGVAEYTYGETISVTYIPEVTATAKSKLISSITVSQATVQNPNATITVTHNDGSTFVYTIHFTITNPCNPTHTAITKSACGSYTWNGTIYTESGNYTYSHPDANG